MSADLSAAFRALEDLYARVDFEAARLGQCAACGKCCHFKTHGHRLYASLLEALYLVSQCDPPPIPFDDDNCGYQEGATCGARQGRVLGCRVYFCEADSKAINALYERALAEIKDITSRAGLDWTYAALADLVSRL